MLCYAGVMLCLSCQEFPKSYEAPGNSNFLLPPALVFCLAVTGVVDDSCQALTSLGFVWLGREEICLCQSVSLLAVFAEPCGNQAL